MLKELEKLEKVDQNINYITQLNEFAIRAALDQNLKSTDVAMYMALFLLWNRSHWKTVLSVNRSELMGISKIGSSATYTKSLKNLTKLGYIKYLPSKNPLVGSKVYMFKLLPSAKHVVNKTKKSSETVTTPYINSKKNKKYINGLNKSISPNLKLEIINYARDNFDGKMFFNYMIRSGFDCKDYKKHYFKYEAYGRNPK